MAVTLTPIPDVPMIRPGDDLAGLMIAARPLSARVSAVGSAVAALLFLGTVSFLFTTPGWEGSLGGFPALSRCLAPSA